MQVGLLGEAFIISKLYQFGQFYAKNRFTYVECSWSENANT